MMTKRVFAFGCSVTSYRWPTWADFVGKSLHNQGYEYYNFANSGSGNEYILQSLFLADAKYKFTPADLILVMWSSWNREDRYIIKYGWNQEVRGQWTKEGNILNAVDDSPRFDRSFLKYWSLEHDISKNYTAIKAARKCFNITHEDSIASYENNPNAERNNSHEPDIATKIFNKFIDANVHAEKTWKSVFDSQRPNPVPALQQINNFDGHPLPNESLDYIDRFTDFDLDISTIKFAKIWERRLIKWKQQTSNEWADDLFTEMIDDVHEAERKDYTKGDYFDLWTDDCFIDLLDDF